MASGRRRITLHESEGIFARLGKLFRPSADAPRDEPMVTGVDFRLKKRASLRAVREFTEQIHSYQLQSRRCVHVQSRYRVPDARGLEQKVPEWIAERVRFGLVRSGGKYAYAKIMRVDIAWDDEGTELFLHLAERVEPGTRAFVAAYLGEEEVRATPEVPGLVGRGS